MKFRAVLAGIVIMVFCISCGCISGTRDSNATAMPTIDDTKWERMLDQSYVLTATESGPDHVVIRIDPDTAYRLKIEGQKPLELMLNPDEKDLYDALGNETDIDFRFITFATKIFSFEGIIRTDPHQKNFEILWMDTLGNPKHAGTTQNVHVVLERYNGDPSIEPVTTNEEPRRSTR
jgi:hypothetical protein